MSDLVIPMTIDDPLQLAWFETNDYGNARRLVVLARGQLKWVDDLFWVAFDGQRWSEREGSFRARSVAHQVAQHIHDEVSALAAIAEDGAALARRFGEWCTPTIAAERVKALSGHANKSGNANQTDAMLKQAKDMAEMRAWGEDFDLDPLTYNVANGTLRFERGEDGAWACRFAEGHRAEDMLRQIATWAYDPDAQCPMWRQRLELIQPDAEQRAVFPRMYGQTLTGLTDCEEFYVHKGRGGDGKTKTHEILAHGHGDYYRHAAVKTFLQASFQKSGSEHRADLVELAGDIRFVVCDEPPPQSTWDGELLKQATGGGELTARGMNAKRPITFKPRWKLFVEVNPTPRMPGDDKGFRRRFRLVQWLVDLNLIPGGYESPAGLRERLWSESSGILNWMIEGCLEWLADRRVPVPERESEALADFWATGNPLGEWLAEECDLTDRDAETGSTVLWNAFKRWMENNEVEEEAQKKWNQTRFGRDLGQRQVIGKKDRRGNKVRRGIKLRSADPLLAAGGSEGRSSAPASAGSPEATARNLPDSISAEWGDDLDPFGGSS